MNQLKLKLKIYGRVQGVGYRQRVFQFVHSQTPALLGYVKNLSDGTVEVMAIADKEELLKLEEFCRKGLLMASVSNIEKEVIEGQDHPYDGFSIEK